MRLQQFVLGELKVNTYLLWDEETLEAVCLIRDPFKKFYGARKGKAKSEIYRTHHGHYDHILGVNALKPQQKPRC